MTMIREEGVYKAVVDSVTLQDNDQPGKAQLVVIVKYQATHRKENGQWVPCEPDEITAWHYLIDKHGAIIKFANDNLVEVFGWNRKCEGVQEFVGKACQITCEEETYDGKTRMKVKWLNAANSEAGSKEVVWDHATAKKASAKFDAKFRALGGGTVVKPAARTATSPPAPAPTPAPAPAAPPAAPPAAKSNTTYDETSCWNRFVEMHGQGQTNEDMEKNWFWLLEEQTGTNDSTNIDGEGWVRVWDAISDFQMLAF